MVIEAGNQGRTMLGRAVAYSNLAAGRRPYMTRGLTPCMRKPGSIDLEGDIV